MQKFRLQMLVVASSKPLDEYLWQGQKRCFHSSTKHVMSEKSRNWSYDQVLDQSTYEKFQTTRDNQ